MENDATFYQSPEHPACEGRGGSSLYPPSGERIQWNLSTVLKLECTDKKRGHMFETPACQDSSGVPPKSFEV